MQNEVISGCNYFFFFFMQDINGLYLVYYCMEQVLGFSGVLLDLNYLYFLLVDNGIEGKYGVEINLCLRFEEVVMKVKIDFRFVVGWFKC